MNFFKISDVLSLEPSFMIIIFSVTCLIMVGMTQIMKTGITHIGDGVQIAHEVIREDVDYLDEDRPLYPDHNKMKELVNRGRRKLNTGK